MSDPSRSALRYAYIVLDGTSFSPPWCAMLSRRRSSQSVPPATAVPGRTMMARTDAAATNTRTLHEGHSREPTMAAEISPESVHQAPLDGPAAQLVPARELELAQYCADVRLDGLRGDAKSRRDLLVEIAARDQPQHLALAGCELVELGIDLPLGDLPVEGVEDEPGQAGREHRVAVAHSLNGVGELGARDRLRDVAARAGADDGDDVLRRIGHRQREEVLCRPALGDPPDYLDTATARHVDVKQHNIGLLVQDGGDRLLDVARRRAHVDQLLELGAHAGAAPLVVVDDPDAGPVAVHVPTPPAS